jgi:hypothetical protein
MSIIPCACLRQIKLRSAMRESSRESVPGRVRQSHFGLIGSLHDLQIAYPIRTGHDVRIRRFPPPREARTAVRGKYRDRLQALEPHRDSRVHSNARLRSSNLPRNGSRGGAETWGRESEPQRHRGHGEKTARECAQNLPSVPSRPRKRESRCSAYGTSSRSQVPALRFASAGMTRFGSI